MTVWPFDRRGSRAAKRHQEMRKQQAEAMIKKANQKADRSKRDKNT